MRTTQNPTLPCIHTTQGPKCGFLLTLPRSNAHPKPSDMFPAILVNPHSTSSRLGCNLWTSRAHVDHKQQEEGFTMGVPGPELGTALWCFRMFGQPPGMAKVLYIYKSKRRIQALSMEAWWQAGSFPSDWNLFWNLTSIFCSYYEQPLYWQDSTREININ